MDLVVGVDTSSHHCFHYLDGRFKEKGVQVQSVKPFALCCDIVLYK